MISSSSNQQPPRSSAPYLLRGLHYPVAKVYRDWEVFASDRAVCFVPFANGIEEMVGKFINRSPRRRAMYHAYCRDLVLVGRNNRYMSQPESDAIYCARTKTVYRREDLPVTPRSQGEYEVLMETLLHDTGHHVWRQLPFRTRVLWHWLFWRDCSMRFQFFRRLFMYPLLKREEEAFSVVFSDYFLGRDLLVQQLIDTGLPEQIAADLGYDSALAILRELPSLQTFRNFERLGVIRARQECV